MSRAGDGASEKARGAGRQDGDRALLADLFAAAVQAADPETALRPHIPDHPDGRLVVIGCGKGAAQLAAAFERLYDGPLNGVVVTRYGYGAPCERIRVLEAAHPVPDAAGLEASAALMGAVQGLGPNDLVVALICGGGSALLPSPAGELELDDEIALNKALLASGAPIGAMNAIRKQVSRIKGGRLAAAAHPARVLSLVVSDVPGDDPAQVASGPTVPDAVTREVARGLVRRWRLDLPPRVAAMLDGEDNLPPRPGDPVFAGHETRVIASAARSLEAAADLARARGLTPVILSDAIEGESREVAGVHAAIAAEIARKGRPFSPPVVLLSGGETTVTLRGSGGRGGRNGEFALALARGIDGLKGVTALAADTDGIDGSEDNAGAFADGASWGRLAAAGDPLRWLDGNDSWGAFETLGDLYVTGPTGTNVNDFRAIIIR